MIGVDVVEIRRVSLKDSFVSRVLTEDEQREYRQYASENRKKEYMAGRFAAKEAIFKATQDKHYLHYSILHKENGMPYVKGHPEIQVSITHDGGIAIAMVLVSL